MLNPWRKCACQTANLETICLMCNAMFNRFAVTCQQTGITAIFRIIALTVGGIRHGRHVLCDELMPLLTCMFVIKLLPFRVYATDRQVWPAIDVQRLGCVVEFMSCTMHECLLQPT